ncbi:MAG: pur operon repressor [Aerococcus sp.]|nr:pur operon repressor [Aerococcus sp.]
MKKIKRSQRMVDLTHILLTHPHQLFSLPYFVEKYDVAKSSLSEDLAIMNEQFHRSGIGRVETTTGASGGLQFIPAMPLEQAQATVETLCEKLTDNERILPGGYFYLTDVLSDPQWLRELGTIIASIYQEAEVTAIMTIATKGIALASAVAANLNVPFVTVQRDIDQTEGSTVSVNYVSGHSPNETVQKMLLTKNSLPRGSRVLLVDDFMNSGGTLTGMLGLIQEFDSTCVGGIVLGELADDKEEITFPYQSLVVIEKTPDNHSVSAVRPGSLFYMNETPAN